jgi:hypothetical protein
MHVVKLKWPGTYQNPEEIDDLEAILQRQRACRVRRDRQTDNLVQFRLET